MKIIKLAFRSILSFRTYSGINLLGLALSLACVITIFRYVYGEFSVDRFNKKIDRIFLTTQERNTNPGTIIFSRMINLNMETPFLDLINHSGVENVSNFILFDNDEITVDEQKYNANLLVADSNFLKIMDYPVISGIHRLSEPNSALITNSFAQKLFGNENPVGKTFRHSNGKILTISGIIGQTSTKSSLSFDMIVSLHLTERWSKTLLTFVLLNPGVDYRVINKQHEDFSAMRSPSSQIRYQLFPLSKVYFDKSISDSELYGQGDYNYVTVLMAVGFLILLTGVINYINIFTVIVLRRGREIGIKKVFGAGRFNIFIQLFVENLLMTGFALIAALFIAHIASPFITNVLQLEQIPNILFNMLLSCVILCSLPLLTTLYPFFRYHYSVPVHSFRSFDKIRGGSLRRVFLSFQYVITIIMIVVSLFFTKQLRFMLNADLGYRTEDIIKVQFQKFNSGLISSPESQRITDEIVQKMNACPLFSYWTYGQSPNEFTQNGFSFKHGDGEFKPVKLKEVDESWLRLFDIQLKEGRLWDNETDSGYRDYYIIVSESVLKLFGITDYSSAMLQPESRLWIMSSTSGNEEMQTNPPYRIVGVVKDFNYRRLSKRSEPVVFYYSKASSRYDPLIASIVPGRTQDAIAFLRKLKEETVGGEFSYSFVEDEVQAMYTEDKKIAAIYSVFTFIAIFVSALGLFSMSLFDIQQRRKEIAIRKINGATIADVIRLLLKKYFWSLLISFALATPVALYAINRYLEDFANKAPVSWWLFAAAIAMTAGVSLLTLIYQTQKAANQNPAEVINN